MFIPIITVFSDVIQLITFQPRTGGNFPFRRPCPEEDFALAETKCAVRPITALRSSLENKPTPLPRHERVPAGG